MEIRAATGDDVDAIRAVARASLGASYGHAITETVLEAAVDRWYDRDALGADIADDRVVFPVTVADGKVVGFAESYVVDRRERVGEIDWLHVHPDHRGEGVGTALLAHVEATLRERGVDRVEGAVLSANEAGTTFYEREGYERVDERLVDIGHDSFPEHRYRKTLSEGVAVEDAETVTTDDGTELHVALTESSRGSEGPFYVVYADPDHEERYGFRCGACGSLDVAVDTMERVVCNECGNRRKPARWDAAYL
ncbi:GNAT family N-acetyltransferase [Haloparvum sedimenti]|uniref:GNAT family N-acetyltransferase n=1 Tax=Haloparvum sedimenti TaxID=1678448 RepID=UPI00071E9C9A|nr:GNAT family N-acetyltransferase [Haloparvum sedimenti]